MKKQLITCILISITISSCNNDLIEVNCESLSKTGIKYYLDDSLFNGNCLQYSGVVLKENKLFKNGMHKKTVGYYDTGEIKYRGGMKNDSIHGTYKEFYKSGKLAKKGKFKMGFYDGKWQFIREDGVILRITIFKNGQVISETDKI